MDQRGLLERLLDVSEELDVSAALLRPDGHVAWVGEAQQVLLVSCRGGLALQSAERAGETVEPEPGGRIRTAGHSISGPLIGRVQGISP